MTKGYFLLDNFLNILLDEILYSNISSRLFSLI